MPTNGNVNGQFCEEEINKVIVDQENDVLWTVVGDCFKNTFKQLDAVQNLGRNAKSVAITWGFDAIDSAAEHIRGGKSMNDFEFPDVKNVPQSVADVGRFMITDGFDRIYKGLNPVEIEEEEQKPQPIEEEEQKAQPIEEEEQKLPGEIEEQPNTGEIEEQEQPNPWICGENQHLNVENNECSCDSGYILKEGSCLAVPNCGNYQVYNEAGNICEDRYLPPVDEGDKNSGNNLALKLALGIGGAVVAAGGALATYCAYRYRKMKNNKNKNDIEDPNELQKNELQKGVDKNDVINAEKKLKKAEEELKKAEKQRNRDKNGEIKYVYALEEKVKAEKKLAKARAERDKYKKLEDKSKPKNETKVVNTHDNNKGSIMRNKVTEKDIEQEQGKNTTEKKTEFKNNDNTKQEQNKKQK